MKNLKTFKYFVVLMFIGVSITSCDELLDPFETDFGKGPVLATFSETKNDLNIIKDAANTPVEYEFEVTYAGGKNVALDKDVNLTISVNADSEIAEGTGFEIITKSLTIPAGETTAKGKIKIFTGSLVPFDFKDLIIEISDSSESIAEVNTFTLTLKALDANTLAGQYKVLVGQYWNSGTRRGDYGGTWTIAAVSPGLYKHVGIGFWPEDNDFYFTVDETTGFITVLDKDPDGEPTLLNGSPIMTCAGGQFEMVTCDNTTNKRTLSPDGHHIVELTTGYYRGAGATREFLQKLERL